MDILIFLLICTSPSGDMSIVKVSTIELLRIAYFVKYSDRIVDKVTFSEKLKSMKFPDQMKTIIPKMN